jgi:carboxyl-terminal processing protease
MQNNMSPLRRVLAGVLAVTKTAACLGLSIALTCSVTARAQTAAPAQSATVFHADVAWSEFSTLLRESYAYFERGSVSGKEILGFFAPAALAAKTDEEFIAVLKTVERNFADPHFLVLPRNAQDMSTIPTVSDIYAEWRNGHVVVVDVRANSHAQQNGVVPGDVVLSVDNLPLDQWVVRLLGRPQSKVSIVQANYAANLALAGLRGARRNLTLQRGLHCTR